MRTNFKDPSLESWDSNFNCCHLSVSRYIFNVCYLQGLRIAPPEAPVTDYMFGKGIKCLLFAGFADCAPRSPGDGLHVRQGNLLRGHGVQVGQLLLHQSHQQHRWAQPHSHLEKFTAYRSLNPVKWLWQPGFRIRIRIRIQEGKNDPQK